MTTLARYIVVSILPYRNKCVNFSVWKPLDHVFYACDGNVTAGGKSD